MKLIVINAPELAAIAAANAAGDGSSRIEPVLLKDGRHVLNADILTGLKDGEDFEEYQEALLGKELPTLEEVAAKVLPPEVVADLVPAAAIEEEAREELKFEVGNRFEDAQDAELAKVATIDAVDSLFVKSDIK